MTTVSDVEQLLRALRGRLPADRGSLVGVEGASTSGKSTLARRLGLESDAIRISTDCYRIPGKLGDRYFDGLHLSDLEGDIRKLRAHFRIVIVEGICLRDTLKTLKVMADIFVYSKRLSSGGIWHDDPELHDAIDGFEESTQRHIDEWSTNYHRRVLPHQQADFIFEWHELE